MIIYDTKSLSYKLTAARLREVDEEQRNWQLWVRLEDLHTKGRGVVRLHRDGELAYQVSFNLSPKQKRNYIGCRKFSPIQVKYIQQAVNNVHRPKPKAKRTVRAKHKTSRRRTA